MYTCVHAHAQCALPMLHHIATAAVIIALSLSLLYCFPGLEVGEHLGGQEELKRKLEEFKAAMERQKEVRTTVQVKG
jgi:hypothetical protein